VGGALEEGAEGGVWGVEGFGSAIEAGGDAEGCCFYGVLEITAKRAKVTR